MGINSIKSKLSDYIDHNQPDHAILALKQHHYLINQELSSVNHHTPLLRAVWRQNYVIARILLSQFQADVNKFGGNYTPLIVASIRGNLQIIKLLLEYKCDPHISTSQGFNSLDYAILFGQYQSSLFLFVHTNIPIKTVIKTYQTCRIKLKLPYVNYQLFISFLQQRVPYQQAVKQIYRKPQDQQTIDLKKQSTKESKAIKLEKKKSDLISTAGQLSSIIKKEKSSSLEEDLQY